MLLVWLLVGEVFEELLISVLLVCEDLVELLVWLLLV